MTNCEHENVSAEGVAESPLTHGPGLALISYRCEREMVLMLKVQTLAALAFLTFLDCPNFKQTWRFFIRGIF